ncbi:MAG: hypothetical protein DLM69_12030, partial [Candidatus Chloroheliales bacterium]
METICRHCGEDFTLPESQRTPAALRCPHCQAVVAGVRYRRCAICGASYRPDYETCPYRDEHPPVSELPVEYYSGLHQLYVK